MNTIEEANISVSPIQRCTIQGRKRNVKKASFHEWDTTFTILSNCEFFYINWTIRRKKSLFRQKLRNNSILVYKQHVILIVICWKKNCFQIFINHYKNNMRFIHWDNLKKSLQFSFFWWMWCLTHLVAIKTILSFSLLLFPFVRCYGDLCSKFLSGQILF